MLTHIWYQFNRAHIQIPYPIREVYTHEEQPLGHAIEETLALLQNIQFLQILTRDQRCELAKRLTTQLFTARETICRQGESGKEFYIIKSGSVEVTARNEHGQTTMVRTMGPSEFFGEISLLTGAPRSATVTALEDAEMLVINKADMRCMLDHNRELAAYVSDVLARRQDYLVQQWTTPAGSAHSEDGNQEHQVASVRQEIFEKIVNFFSY